MPKIVFFETYSPLQIIVTRKQLRDAHEICFSEKLYPSLQTVPLQALARKLVLYFLKLFKVDSKVNPLSQEWIREQNWEANRAALRRTAALEDVIKSKPVFRSMLTLIKSSLLVRFFQFRHVNWLAGRLLFLELGKRFVAQHGVENVVLVPKICRYDFEAEEKGALGKTIPAAIQRVNYIRHHIGRWVYVGLLTLYPVGYLCSHVKRFRIFGTQPKPSPTYDVMMPVLYGFFDTDKQIVRHGVKRSNDDSILYNATLKKGAIIHLFGIWQKSATKERKNKRIMDKQGLPYADTRTFTLNRSFVLKGMSVQLRMFGLLFKNLLQSAESFELYYSSLFALKALLEKELELANIDYKVEFVRNDYNPIHIVRTIINQSYGKQSVGIQHHINCDDFPALAFAYFDRYIVYGDLIVKSFMPYWQQLNLSKTGRENIDFVATLNADHDYQEKIRNRINLLYGQRRHTVLFTLPSGHPLNDRNQWHRFYEGLNRVMQTDMDFRAFLRFRSTLDYEQHEHCHKVARLASEDPRFILDHDNFTIHELMAVSDMVIANSVSFSIWESLVAGAKVFSFDFIGVARYYLDGYGRDLILRSPEQLENAFAGLTNRFQGFDVDWDRLARDCNYYSDGRNHERIQATVVGAVNAVSSRLNTRVNKSMATCRSKHELRD